MDQSTRSRSVEQSSGAPGIERKIRVSQWALLFEQLWPRVWALVGLGAVFVVASLVGLWPALPEIGHQIALALFALAAGAILVSIIRLRLPSRDAALERMEQSSGVPHRPASAYEDTLTINATDASTQSLWQAHRERLQRLIARLRPARPAPRTDKRDPFAMRALALLSVVVLGVSVGDSAADRLWSAFRFGPLVRSADARLDAWITPPPYTGKAPVMLADGSRPGSAKEVAERGTIEIPERSLLVARGSGRLGGLVLEITEPGKPPVRIDPKAEAEAAAAKDAADAKAGIVKQLDSKAGEKIAAKAPAQSVAGTAQASAIDDVAEVKGELRKSGTVRLLAGSSTLAIWSFTVIPDMPPVASLTKEAERTLRGALRIPYKVEDDYGVASLEARFLRPANKADTSRTAWARAEKTKIKGPRPPLERPPVLAVRLNQSYPKSATGMSLHEVGDNLWAGLPVRMQLVAKDLAGQTGRSEPTSMIMPARLFRKSLAKAIIEQRGRLVDDPRQTRDVMRAIEIITMEPDEFIKDLKVYTGLRSVYHRLALDPKNTRAVRHSAIKQLWSIAVRIEDGSLSDAQRNLKEIQEKLSQALRDGASDEEIQKLMQELRQAMAEFMQELQRQAENMPPQDPNQQQQQQGQQYSQRDLDQMMRNLEDMARSGNRDMAQQMLSELQDLMERLQSGRMQQGQQGQQGQGQQGQMNQMMNELGELLGRQQQLLDDTFQQQQGQDGQQGQGQQGQQGQGQQGQRGQQGQGQGQQGQRGQQGQQGQGQRGQQGQQGQQGQGQGQPGQQGQGAGALGDRQESLRGMLDRLQRGMQGMGMPAPEQFGEAGRAMQDAERALRNGDLPGAAEAEGRALDQLRQGARNMAEEMARQMQRQAREQGGPNGNPGELDPLGRAPRETTDGSDPGLLTKIPDQIDAQRAREILEELRKRLGDQQRPAIELEYLERLLKRF